MGYNSNVSKVILTSMESMDMTSIHSHQTTTRPVSSLETIANLIVAASNYRAAAPFGSSTKPLKSPNKDNILENQNIPSSIISDL